VRALQEGLVIMRLVGLKHDLWSQIKFLNSLLQVLERLFFTKGHCHPRQEAKVLVYLYKMLTTCLIVLIFGSRDFHHY